MEQQQERPIVAILAAQRTGQAWLAGVARALELAGARTVVPATPEHARACAALVLAGDAATADVLRMQPAARRLVLEMDEAGRTVGAIGHGAWLLVSAGLVAGRSLASWPSLQDDIRNAGGEWVDREVVVDGNWVSSRGPDDLAAFSRELVRSLCERTAGATP